MNEEDSEVYDFDDLIRKLVDIKEQGTGYINYAKAFLTLARKIESLDDRYKFKDLDCFTD